MKRKKVDWLQMIKDADLEDKFDLYCAENDFKQHKKGKRELSRKRLACAYMRSIAHIIQVRWLPKNTKPITEAELD